MVLGDFFLIFLIYSYVGVTNKFIASSLIESQNPIDSSIASYNDLASNFFFSFSNSKIYSPLKIKKIFFFFFLPFGYSFGKVNVTFENSFLNFKSAKKIN